MLQRNDSSVLCWGEKKLFTVYLAFIFDRFGGKVLARKGIEAQNGEFGSGGKALGDGRAGFASSQPPARQLH